MGNEMKNNGRQWFTYIDISVGSLGSFSYQRCWITYHLVTFYFERRPPYRMHTYIRVISVYIIYVWQTIDYLLEIEFRVNKTERILILFIFVFQFQQEITKTTTDRDRRNQRRHATNQSFRPALVYHWPEVALVPLHRTVSSNGNFSANALQTKYLIGRVAFAKNCCMPFQIIHENIVFRCETSDATDRPTNEKTRADQKKYFSLI